MPIRNVVATLLLITGCPTSQSPSKPRSCADGSPMAPSIGDTCPSMGVCRSVSEVIELKPRIIVRDRCGSVRVVANDHHLSLHPGAARKLFPATEETD